MPNKEAPIWKLFKLFGYYIINTFKIQKIFIYRTNLLKFKTSMNL